MGADSQGAQAAGGETRLVWRAGKLQRVSAATEAAWRAAVEDNTAEAAPDETVVPTLCLECEAYDPVWWNENAHLHGSKLFLNGKELF